MVRSGAAARFNPSGFSLEREPTRKWKPALSLLPEMLGLDDDVTHDNILSSK